MRRARLFGFTLALAVAAASGAATTSSDALADDQQGAAESFRAGAKAFDKGDFRTAAGDFERAYHLAPHGSPMYNAGLAWESAHEPARAADAYQLALATPGLDAKQKNDAQNRLASLERSVARVEVTGPEGTKVSCAHVSNVALPTKFHLSAGEHDLIVIRPDGREETKTIGVAAGSVAPVVIPGAPPVAAPPSAQASAPPPEQPPPKEASASASASTSASSNGPPPQRLIGFVAIGGAVVAAGAGILFGASALNARDKFDASGHTDQAAHDDASSKRTLANVCWVGAVVLGAAGVVLVVTAKPPHPSIPPPSNALFGKPEVAIGVGPGDARIRVRF
jgi:hypothetical protein